MEMSVLCYNVFHYISHATQPMILLIIPQHYSQMYVLLLLLQCEYSLIFLKLYLQCWDLKWL